MIFILTLLACANTGKAEEDLARYASSNYPGWEVVNASCEKIDSDGNGRVRCNLSVKNPESGDIKTPAVECPSSHLPQFASDCQAVKR